MALLAGGGYAQKVAVPIGQIMSVPTGIGLVEAAALPEVVCTVWSNLDMVANLSEGEWLLVHGGGSGIGTDGHPARPRAGRAGRRHGGQHEQARPLRGPRAPRCSSTTTTRTSST